MELRILDSGARREFKSGAVRDIAEGKGRMDLMPLSVLAEILNQQDIYAIHDNVFTLPYMLGQFGQFVYDGIEEHLITLFLAFVNRHYNCIEDAILDLSIHYEEGAKKYCERNWEKGINTHCFVDSAVRHGVKLLRGDEDEPHNRAFMWNILGLLWTIDNKPDFNDLPYTLHTVKTYSVDEDSDGWYKKMLNRLTHSADEDSDW